MRLRDRNSRRDLIKFYHQDYVGQSLSRAFYLERAHSLPFKRTKPTINEESLTEDSCIPTIARIHHLFLSVYYRTKPWSASSSNYSSSSASVWTIDQPSTRLAYIKAFLAIFGWLFWLALDSRGFSASLMDRNMGEMVPVW